MAGARRDERGQAILELALIAPVLLTLLLAAIDLGRVYYAQVTVSNAARAGVLEYTTNEDATYTAGAACDRTTNSVTCAIVNEASNSTVNVTPSDVTVQCTPSCAKAIGNRIEVRVTGRFNVLTPLLWAFTGGSQITFTQVVDADMVYIPPNTVAAPAPSSSASEAPSSSPSGSAEASGSADPSASASASPTPAPSSACLLPVPQFTSSQQNRNHSVEFASGSTPTVGPCAITFWRWEYGDGASDAGNVPTVSHDYGVANRGKSFNVTLSVTNAAGVMSITQLVTTLGSSGGGGG